MKVREIIDLAIQENRSRETLLVMFAGVFVALGAAVLVWGLIQDSIVAYAGVVESGLFVPAGSRSGPADQSRKHRFAHA